MFESCRYSQKADQVMLLNQGCLEFYVFEGVQLRPFQLFPTVQWYFCDSQDHLASVTTHV